MSEKLQRFTKLLRDMFELEKSDLDFGIYRIMNIRKNQINNFIENTLASEVNSILSKYATDNSQVRKRIEEIEKQCESVGVKVEDSKLREEYAEYKALLASGTGVAEMESDVYSALYNFFSRYYDEGDFISKRRYKEGVYAIPYEGEEVKLYWANHDQYYIKTSENFRDYSKIFGNPSLGLIVPVFKNTHLSFSTGLFTQIDRDIFDDPSFDGPWHDSFINLKLGLLFGI